VPGKVLQSALIVFTHVKLWLGLHSSYIKLLLYNVSLSTIKGNN